MLTDKIQCEIPKYISFDDFMKKWIRKVILPFTFNNM